MTSYSSGLPDDFHIFGFMKEPPFEHVVITGLVRDAQGANEQIPGQRYRPLEVIDKYGADTLRFTLIQAMLRQ